MNMNSIPKSTLWITIVLLFLAQSLLNAHSRYKKQPISYVLNSADQICVRRFDISSESNTLNQIGKVDVNYLTAALSSDAFHFKDTDTLLIDFICTNDYIGPEDFIAVSSKDTLFVKPQHYPRKKCPIRRFFHSRSPSGTAFKRAYERSIKKVTRSGSFKRQPTSLSKDCLLIYEVIKNNDIEAFKELFSQFGETLFIESWDFLLRIEIQNGTVVDASSWEFCIYIPEENIIHMQYEESGLNNQVSYGKYLR